MNAPLHREIPAGILDAAQALSQVTAQWDADIVKQLTDYIAIPAKSPSFDADWAKHGFIDSVMRNAASWVEAQKVEGLTLEVVRLEGRTPVLFFEIPASSGRMGASPPHQPWPRDRLSRTAGAAAPPGGSELREARSVGAISMQTSPCSRAVVPGHAESRSSPSPAAASAARPVRHGSNHAGKPG